MAHADDCAHGVVPRGVRSAASQRDGRLSVRCYDSAGESHVGCSATTLLASPLLLCGRRIRDTFSASRRSGRSRGHRRGTSASGARVRESWPAREQEEASAGYTGSGSYARGGGRLYCSAAAHAQASSSHGAHFLCTDLWCVEQDCGEDHRRVDLVVYAAASSSFGFRVLLRVRQEGPGWQASTLANGGSRASHSAGHRPTTVVGSAQACLPLGPCVGRMPVRCWCLLYPHHEFSRTRSADAIPSQVPSPPYDSPSGPFQHSVVSSAFIWRCRRRHQGRRSVTAPRLAHAHLHTLEVQGAHQHAGAPRGGPCAQVDFQVSRWLLDSSSYIHRQLYIFLCHSKRPLKRPICSSCNCLHICSSARDRYGSAPCLGGLCGQPSRRALPCL